MNNQILVIVSSIYSNSFGLSLNDKRDNRVLELVWRPERKLEAQNIKGESGGACLNVFAW